MIFDALQIGHMFDHISGLENHWADEEVSCTITYLHDYGKKIMHLCYLQTLRHGCI